MLTNSILWWYYWPLLLSNLAHYWCLILIISLATRTERPFNRLHLHKTSILSILSWRPPTVGSIKRSKWIHWLTSNTSTILTIGVYLVLICIYYQSLGLLDSLVNTNICEELINASPSFIFDLFLWYQEFIEFVIILAFIIIFLIDINCYILVIDLLGFFD